MRLNMSRLSSVRCGSIYPSWRKRASGELTANGAGFYLTRSPDFPRAASTWDMWGSAPDITERKKTEQSLQFQNSLIRAIHEVSLDGILVVSDDYLIASHNKKFKEVWQ